MTTWEKMTAVPNHHGITEKTANALWLQEAKKPEGKKLRYSVQKEKKEWKQKFKLQERAREMTVLEAAENIYCAALMASTLLPRLQLHRSNVEINSDSEEMHLTSIFKVKDSCMG